MALVLVEHALIVLAVVVAAVVRLGMPDAPPAAYTDWVGARRRGRGRAAGLPALRRPLRPAHAGRPPGPAHRAAAGARRGVGHPGRPLLLVPGLVIGRGVFALATVLIVALVAGWRVAFEWLSLRGAPDRAPADRRHRRRGGHAGARAVRAPQRARRRARRLRRPRSGARSARRSSTPASSAPSATFPTIVRGRRVDRVVVSLADARGKLPMDELLEMKLNDGVRFDHLASVYEEYTGKIAVENLRPSWLIFSEGFRKSRRARGRQAPVRHRASRWSAWCWRRRSWCWSRSRCASARRDRCSTSQTRVGQDGVPFTIHKFRSMRVDAEAATRRGVGHAERPARHAGRPLPAPDAARRAAAALERAAAAT